MKEAVLIQCHKNSEQVNMLLETLHHPDVDIYVHVDKKSDIGEKLIKNPQVRLLPDKLRVDVRWARFSQVQATLEFAALCLPLRTV